jgi:cation/acetate symporter
VPIGIITIVVVSMLTPEPGTKVKELVEHVRYPNLRGDISTQAA